METAASLPSLYEWAGGQKAFDRLTQVFYQRIPLNKKLEPIFREMPSDHPQHVALFIAEVLGGPAVYSTELGGHAEMIRHHLNRMLTEEQRREWMTLLLECADEIGLPTDPEFRSAFVAYVEWGTRLAVINSQPGAVQPSDDSPMPKWSWGVPGGPYMPE